MHSKTRLILVALASAPALAQSGLYVEEAKLIGSDTNAGDGFGAAVALDGDTALIGAPRADPNERGAAYVFVRSNGGWTMQAKLVASLGTNADFDHFGESVALDGDVAVIGAPDWGAEDGHVHVFRRNGTTWIAEQLLGPPTTGYFYRFGADVAVSGNTLAASAPLFGAQHEGTVAIYELIGGTWTFNTWVESFLPNTDDYMGEDIDLSPAGGIMRLIVTTRAHGALTFSNATGPWRPRFGIGQSATPYDGVALSGTTIVIAESNATVGGSVGAGKVFVWVGSAAANVGPSFQANITANDAAAGDRFGWSVDVGRDVLVVGAPFESDVSLASRGAAYVFERVASTWHQRAKLVAIDAAAGDHFGHSLGVAGASLVLGAPDDSNAAGVGAGAAYADRFGNTTVSYCTPGISTAGCSATLSSTGSPSASLATPFSIDAANLDGQRFGLVFYGASGTQAWPWGSASWLCVKPPLQRSRAQLSNGTAGACDGALTLDWNLFLSQHPTALGQPFGAGDIVWTQVWYRDPASIKTTQLSDALAFLLQP